MASVATPLSGFRFEAPDPDPVVPAVAAPATKVDAPAVTQAQFDALQRELDETRGSNRQLMEIVGRNTPTPAKANAPTAGDEDDLGIDWGTDEADAEDTTADEDPAVLVDEISKHGIAALGKRGFMRTADVKKMVREESRKAAVTASRQVVQRARVQATSESTIMSEFPDLADQNSELFKATIPHVQAAARFNPKAATDPSTLYLAARAAQAELRSRGRQREDDDTPAPRRAGRAELDERDDRSDRDIRIASQQGDRGRSRSRIESGDDTFVMSDDARSVAKAMGLTDDEYKTEATRVRPAAARGRR